jgi:hypothetical protein
LLRTGFHRKKDLQKAQKLLESKLQKPQTPFFLSFHNPNTVFFKFLVVSYRETPQPPLFSFLFTTRFALLQITLRGCVEATSSPHEPADRNHLKPQSSSIANDSPCVQNQRTLKGCGMPRRSSAS